MSDCFFVTDLHGSIPRYQQLFNEIELELPKAMFIGGDNFPHFLSNSNSTDYDDFFEDIFLKGFLRLKEKLKNNYPKVYLILGNDDGLWHEQEIIEADKLGIWNYVHNKNVNYKNYQICGYNFVPPTPFQLKDWEKYDVSRYVDPGCVPIEEGKHTKAHTMHELKYSTIQKDLEQLVKQSDLSKSIFLFHSPPYKTNLDRAALDGKMINHAPLDVHVGSIAIKRFIKTKQPLLTLHGHIHESARITGSWKDKVLNTFCFTAAHDGQELAIVKFNLEKLEKSSRVLL